MNNSLENKRIILRKIHQWRTRFNTLYTVHMFRSPGCGHFVSTHFVTTNPRFLTVNEVRWEYDHIPDNGRDCSVACTDFYRSDLRFIETTFSHSLIKSCHVYFTNHTWWTCQRCSKKNTRWAKFRSSVEVCSLYVRWYFVLRNEKWFT